MSQKKTSSPQTKQSALKQIAQVTQQFSGPVPHPEILNGYNQVIPGAAERILKMAEDDALHQRDMEKSALKLASDEVKRGQRYGLTIGVLTFLTCIIALILGSEKTAIALGGTTVVGLVTVFVTGRFKKNK